MKRLFIVFFLLIPPASSLLAQETASPATTRCSATTCRITLNESYSNAKSIHLPATFFASRLLRYAGVTTINEPDQKADLDVALALSGSPRGTIYSYAGQDKGMRYSGAYVSGSIVIRQSDGVIYKGSFESESPVRDQIGELEYLTPESAPFLAAFYQDAEQAFFSELSHAVGILFGPEPLIPALRDGNQRIRRAAARALKRMHWNPVGEQEAYLLVANGECSPCVSLGAIALKPLIEAASLRVSEEDRFGDFTHDSAHDAGYPVVSEDLDFHEKDLRKEAVRALGEIGDPQATDAVILALKNRYPPEMEKISLEALASIGGNKATDAIVDELKNSIECQALAAQLLGKMKASRAVDALTVAMNGAYGRGTEQQRALTPLQESALHALAQIKDPRSIKPILSLIKRKSQFEYMNWDPSTTALLEYHDLAVRPLIGMLTSTSLPMRLGAIYVLGKSGSAQATSPILGCLNDSNVEVVAYAIEALGALKEHRAVKPLLTRFVRSKNWELQVRAIAALGDIEDVEAVDPLLKLLPSLYTAETIDFSPWTTAGEALGKIHDARALEPLLALAHKPDIVENHLMYIPVLTALSHYDDNRIAAVYLSALQDRRITVRVITVQGLDRYADSVPAGALDPLFLDQPAVRERARALLEKIRASKPR